MALPKEPRQKMINIMYLVLTALLALNVSSEILNAFKTVDNSLQRSSTVVGISTATYLKSLQDKMGKPESKDSASKWYPKAQTAQELSNGMYNFIQGIKDSILRAADFNPQQNGDSAFKEDNLDISTRILVDDGYGKQLFQQLKDYRDKMLALDPEIDNEFQDNLPIDLTMPRVQNKHKGQRGKQQVRGRGRIKSD